jgi:hypothetical protein
LVVLLGTVVTSRAADDAPTAPAPAQSTVESTPTTAQPGSLAQRIEQIRRRSQAAVAAARGNRAELQAALKTRREELAVLAAEIETADASKLSLADRLTLAELYARDLQQADDAARHAQVVLDAEPTNDLAWTVLINAQASNPSTLQAAEANLAKATAVLTPDQRAPLHTIIGNWQMRAGQHRAAADHYAAHLDLARATLLRQANAASAYMKRVEQTIAAYGRAKADDVALSRIDRELAALATDDAPQGGLASLPTIATPMPTPSRSSWAKRSCLKRPRPRSPPCACRSIR